MLLKLFGDFWKQLTPKDKNDVVMSWLQLITITIAVITFIFNISQDVSDKKKFVIELAQRFEQSAEQRHAYILDLSSYVQNKQSMKEDQRRKFEISIAKKHDIAHTQVLNELQRVASLSIYGVTDMRMTKLMFCNHVRFIYGAQKFVVNKIRNTPGLGASKAYEELEQLYSSCL